MQPQNIYVYQWRAVTLRQVMQLACQNLVMQSGILWVANE